MAGVPVTIVGVAYYTDLSVGGGPIVPGPGGPQSVWTRRDTVLRTA
jgi:hypothetical protein